MKKSTIILCSFALFLVIAGLILCAVGKAMGDVFDDTVTLEEGTVVPTDIRESIKKIVVNYSNATINVYGGQAETRIETINVDEDHIVSRSATELSISDKTDYLSMVYDTITNFSGLRNILFPGKSYTGDKTINIYIADQDLTQITLEIGSGDITLSDLSSNTTYGITIREEGNVSVSNIQTSSRMEIQVGTGNVSLKNVTAPQITGSISIRGNFHCDEKNPGGHNYYLSCDPGTIYILEESQPQAKPYEIRDAEDSSTLEFTVTHGNIHINQFTEQNTENSEKVE